eukprot:TRINITY_DN166_c0_g1_i1.p1 TRINITY_DN166_c0_g1~~TRINITY_DN166_c0_g1_i1.p1  ORF type:complete len:158 (+),score=16.10 TRINITY_DN166_c0_g1_i1:123-596(+)
MATLAATGVTVRPYIPAMSTRPSSSVSFTRPLRVASNVSSFGLFQGLPSQFRLQVVAKKRLEGKVIHTKHKKTVKVEVVRWEFHPMYKKIWKRKTFYMAHDPEGKFKVGDMVELKKCQPLSKKKHHLAVPLPPRAIPPKPSSAPPDELDIPRESATV